MILSGVRIFPGQDPAHTYVGWVTTQYHLHSKDFNQNQVRKSSVWVVDDFDRVVDGYDIINHSIIFKELTRYFFSYIASTDNLVTWLDQMNCTTK